MKTFTFDVCLFATVRVDAESREEAENKLSNYTGCLDIGMTTPDGVRFTEASADGSPELIEIDGEAV